MFDQDGNYITNDDELNEFEELESELDIYGDNALEEDYA